MYRFCDDRDMFPNCLDSTDWPIIATNTRGVMGAGQAGAYAQWDAYGKAQYVARCKQGHHRMGEVMLVKGEHGIAICLPTMERPGTRLPNGHHIRDALFDLTGKLRAHQLRGLTIHVPQLGCGIGGLKWEDVRSAVISAALLDLDNDYVLYGREQ